MLGAIVHLRSGGSAVAIDSVRAMSFRTGVWLVLFPALAWMARRAHPR